MSEKRSIYKLKESFLWHLPAFLTGPTGQSAFPHGPSIEKVLLSLFFFFPDHLKSPLLSNGYNAPPNPLNAMQMMGLGAAGLAGHPPMMMGPGGFPVPVSSHPAAQAAAAALQNRNAAERLFPSPMGR